MKKQAFLVLLIPALIYEEPIVCSPEDAIKSFLLGNIDVLSIGPFICYLEKQIDIK